MLVEQPRLGKPGMVLLITLCNIIAPLSTDMYMPALPEMKVFFGTNDAIMNLTLVGFFLFFAIGMLVFGPISDRNGRKPVLSLGIIVYVVASVGCTLAGTIWILILMRLVQALGAGCMIAVSTAIVKDQFSGAMQGSVLSLAQVFGVVGPIAAPVIGTFIYSFASWRMIFLAQGIITLLMLIVTLLMRETLPREQRLDVGVIRSLSRLGVVMKNRTFTLFLAGIILLHAPFMAYICASSYIYQDFFGLSPSMYTAYFAITALVSVAGPILYSLAKRRNPFKMAFILILVPVACGAGLLLAGHSLPIAFAALVAVLTMCIAATRPFAMTILLNLQEKDTGAASSLINFAFTIMGTIGMFLITGIWRDYVLGLAILCIITGIAGALLVVALLKKEGPHSLDVF
ncbi:MAG: MFS transporter [Coriobacteriales bacterium]|jgi:DHA1 family bicyclomycin/chloramphenicol resistance-like MFS transporter